jgi:hypothetical protein
LRYHFDRPAPYIEMNAPSAQRPSELWTVWRIDDNANVFVVREHLTRDEAERVVAEITARGHKQTYWAEREAVPGHGEERP